MKTQILILGLLILFVEVYALKVENKKFDTVHQVELRNGIIEIDINTLLQINVVHFSIEKPKKPSTSQVFVVYSSNDNRSERIIKPWIDIGCCKKLVALETQRNRVL